MSLDLAVFGLYVILMLGISVWSLKFMKDMGDFLLAGRDLGPWVSAFSSSSSLATGYTYTGAPGLAYSMGWSSMWFTLPEGVASVLNFSLLGRRVRRMSQLLGALTVPDFLARRLQHNSVRISSSAIIILFMSIYTAVQFSAAALILEVAFGLDYGWGVWLTVLAIIAITWTGGYLAASVTDFFQAILMWGGTLLVIILGLIHVGGFAEFNNRLGEFGPNMTTLFRPDFGIWDALAILLGFSIGIIGLPHVLTRLYSLKSDRIAGKAAVRNGVFWTIFGQCYYALGLLTVVILGGQAIENPETAAVELWTELLPSGLLGLMVSAAVAAVVSSAASFLMVLAGTVMRDILQPYVMRERDQSALLTASRLSVVALAAAGGILAMLQVGSIFSLVAFAVGAAGIAFGIPHLLAISWRRLTWQGVLAGQVIGIAVYVSVSVLDFSVPAQFGISIPLTLAVIVLVSVATFKGMSPEMTAIFDRTCAFDDLVVGEGEDLAGSGSTGFQGQAGGARVK